MYVREIKWEDAKISSKYKRMEKYVENNPQTIL